jgi:hypothetical protein
MDTTQQLHLGIGRIFQGNQFGGKMKGYSTLLTHAFHFFTHDITSSTLASEKIPRKASSGKRKIIYCG